MKGLGVAAAAAAAMAMMGGVGGVYGADLATKAPVLTAPADATCLSILDFFTTACQLSAYGVRVYGTVDVGFGYQTHGAPLDRNFVTGASYFLQKMNRSAMWGLAPNGLSQSNIGIQIKEPPATGWSFVAQFEAGFDPSSLRLASSPRLGPNLATSACPLTSTTNGDSSRAGQFYNALGFLGVSSDTYGTPTFFRQNALTTDGVLAYDPMAGSYGFSPISFSEVVGGGDTENARYSTSAKYRVNIRDFRLAAVWQFGGYDLNNASRGAWEGQVRSDIRHPQSPSRHALDGRDRQCAMLNL